MVTYEYIRGQGWIPRQEPEVLGYCCSICGLVQKYPLIAHTRLWLGDGVPRLCHGIMKPYTVDGTVKDVDLP